MIPDVSRWQDNSSRTDLWRAISYVVGDEHADRICKLISIYCWLFRVPPGQVSELKAIR